MSDQSAEIKNSTIIFLSVVFIVLLVAFKGTEYDIGTVTNSHSNVRMDLGNKEQQKKIDELEKRLTALEKQNKRK